jgi:hypothetical protein
MLNFILPAENIRPVGESRYVNMSTTLVEAVEVLTKYLPVPLFFIVHILPTFDLTHLSFNATK